MTLPYRVVIRNGAWCRIRVEMMKPTDVLVSNVNLCPEHFTRQVIDKKPMVTFSQPFVFTNLIINPTRQEAHKIHANNFLNVLV